MVVEVAPQGCRSGRNVGLEQLQLRVTQEGAELVSIEPLGNFRDVAYGKLEAQRELVDQLGHAVQELQEHLRFLLVVGQVHSL